MKIRIVRFLILIAVSFMQLLPVHAEGKEKVQIVYDEQIPQLSFAVEKIKEAIEISDLTWVPSSGNIKIEFLIQSKGEKAESFKMIRKKNEILIDAEDAAGAMYGGFELAELIQIGGLQHATSKDHSPYMEMRGIKFNIPLDVRTPSYTDVSDVAQHNIPEMWNFEFWKNFIDSMASNRYNFVSLWSLHPFPSLVKVPEYPDVALDDVHRSTGDWKEYYSLNATGFDAPEIVNDFEVVKKITIEEKIEFWRKVMRYGKERNIDFYFITWNSFVNGTAGKYGITTDLDNETTVDYLRKSVKQMFLTYPDLAGVGLTPGENMRTSDGKHAKSDVSEPWLFDTYGQGILDAGKVFPDRKMMLIHRQHMSAARDISKFFQPVIDRENTDFIFSFKYAKAHVMSCTKQPYHPNFVKDIEQDESLKTIWTLRNDSNYYFRWGAPDFVREFITNIPYHVSRGFYYGSDQWIWGREFLSLDPEKPRQIEVDKHWYHWMMWGRLGYDPTMNNERFEAILQAHFPNTNAKLLFTAWQSASMIYPLTTGFHWGPVDFKWYIEGCRSTPGQAHTESGFHDVNRFITLPPHPETGNISIPDYVKIVTEKVEIEGITPPQVAEKIHATADRALNLLKTINGENKELIRTISDIHSMAFLGKYYAHKIQGATELALYRETGEKTHQEHAVLELTHAAKFWKQYMDTSKKQYINPIWTNRVGYVNWEESYQEALKDIKTAEND